MAKYMKIEEVQGIIKTVRNLYPEDVFLPPKPESTPDCYAAAGARLACDAIMEMVSSKATAKEEEK